MVQQCVYQRAGVVARRRMHHHAARLVKHYHIVIFVNYIQRNVFRYGFNRLRFGNIHHKHFAGAYFVIGFYNFFAAFYAPILQKLLHIAARNAEFCRQKHVSPCTGVLRFCRYGF